MKKLFAAILAFSMLLSLGLTACTGNDKPGSTDAPTADAGPTAAPDTSAPATDAPPMLTFENGLASTLSGVYISPSESTVWGELLAEGLESEASCELSFAQLEGEPGTLFDIGTVDEDQVNYDAYDVRLEAGDVIRLTGDGESGSFTITRADGSVEEVIANVYSDSDPVNPVTGIAALYPNIESVSVVQSINESESPVFACMSYDLIHLASDEEDYYPGLHEAVEARNEERADEANERFRELCAGYSPAEDGAGLTYTVEAFVRRADNGVLSVLYKTEITVGNNVSYSFSADNYSVSEGRLLTPADIVTDTGLLPGMINSIMIEQGGVGFLLDASTDYTEYFTVPHCGDFAWVHDRDGITFIFNEDAFGNEDAFTSIVFLPFKDFPELSSYKEAPENYVVSFPRGVNTYAELGGEICSVFVSGMKNEYGLFDTLFIGFGTFSFEEPAEAFEFEPMLVHYNGGDYIYVQTTGYNDWRGISVFRLGAAGIKKLGDLNASLFHWDTDTEDDGAYSRFEEPITDPEGFMLSTRTGLLSTADGYRFYWIGESGMPVSEDTKYILTDRYEFTLLRELEVTRIGTAGEDLGTVVLGEGEKLTYVATNDTDYAEFQLIDGSVVGVMVDVRNGEKTIGGVSVFDIFEGMRFAG